jgi:hypothetical protein
MDLVLAEGTEQQSPLWALEEDVAEDDYSELSWP